MTKARRFSSATINQIIRQESDGTPRKMPRVCESTYYQNIETAILECEFGGYGFYGFDDKDGKEHIFSVDELKALLFMGYNFLEELYDEEEVF